MKVINFLSNNWYFVIAGICIITLIVSYTILLTQKVPETTKKNCRSNLTDKQYIANVQLSSGSCPDGYLSAPQKVQFNDAQMQYNLCYQVPNQICDGDALVSDLKIVPPSTPCGCENGKCVDKTDCKKDSDCCTSCNGILVDAFPYRCKDANYSPVVINSSSPNIDCSGVINLQKGSIGYTFCQKQQYNNKNTMFMTADSLTFADKINVCPPGYTKLNYTNLCLKK
jgi:hypothetical protein